VAFLRLRPIEHDLGPHFADLRALANRRALQRSALWKRIAPEVERVTSAVERGDQEACLRGGPGRVRIAAWNVKRGARFDALLAALREDATLAGADIILLTEIDCGLGRSANRNVARDLAAALGMSYVFAPSYLTLEDDWGENSAGVANTLSLAGMAILTRAAIRSAENVDLPELRDKFSSSERRLGRKRALLAEVQLPDRPLRVAACHLDSNASPCQRARQLQALLERIDAGGSSAAIVGGDFNASTHDLSSPIAIVWDVLRKMIGRGLRKTIDAYMRPEEADERPLFDLLVARGFTLDGANDRTLATYRYDFNDPYALQKLRRAGGPPLVWLIRRLLRPWSSCLPARLDWFATRALRPVAATVVDPRDSEGRPISDHAAIVCDLAL
jgi:endonuclease/exonuclease/phosphatase family metal-dependent hydrolase